MSNIKSSNKILWIIFLTIFIDMLGIGILIPVFPMLIVSGSEFNVIPAGWSNADAFIMAGWLLASFPIAQFFCTPILGQMSDKYGRRKILAISITGTAFSYLLFAYAIMIKNIPLMFISRVLDGASGGNISIAQAVIGDISEPAKRAKNFGLIGIALGLGFVFGPFIGGKLSDSSITSCFNAATPFWFTAILSSLNVLLVLKFLPETATIANNKYINLTKPLNNIFLAFKSSDLRIIILVVFLFNAGFTFFTTFWGVVLAEQFNFTSGNIGNFFAYMGIMVILAQGGLVRRLSGKVQDSKVLRFSIVGAGLCLMAYYFIAPKQWLWIYYITPFLAFFMALTKAFSNALITRITSPTKLGEAMGINSSASALANALPALLAGYIASQHARLPILVGSITILIGGIFFRLCFKTKNRV